MFHSDQMVNSAAGLVAICHALTTDRHRALPKGLMALRPRKAADTSHRTTKAAVTVHKMGVAAELSRPVIHTARQAVIADHRSTEALVNHLQDLMQTINHLVRRAVLRRRLTLTNRQRKKPQSKKLSGKKSKTCERSPLLHVPTQRTSIANNG
jgi:hypothetical protein